MYINVKPSYNSSVYILMMTNTNHYNIHLLYILLYLNSKCYFILYKKKFVVLRCIFTFTIDLI